MKGSLRQSMAWLHTWVGLLLGWLLFAVFLTGTTAYFQNEITRWMQPEVRGPRDAARSVQGAIAYLQTHAQGAQTWTVQLPEARSVAAMGYWKEPGETFMQWRDHAFMVDGTGHTVDARDTTGGWLLYRLHFDLHYVPVLWGRWAVGLAAMFMLVAIISGVITHKKIFADFFTLRLGKGQRSWLDAHNLTAVLALPFHFMITYTGLVTLMSLYMPWGIKAAYTDPARYYAEAFGTQPPTPAAGRPGPLADVGEMLRQARVYWNGAEAGTITITHPGDARAIVHITRATDQGMASRAIGVEFDAATGHMHTPPPQRGGAAATESVMVGLHAGRFAPTLLRWLYFVCGLAGTAMVGSGLVLWTAKRRLQLPDPARPHLGFRLVERLNIATVAGLPLGIAAYFLANRLLPVDLGHRAQWEANTLFIAWGAAAVLAFVRPARQAWTETLAAGALAFVAVPIVNAATTRRGLLPSLLEGDWVFAGFDLTMLVMAALLAFAAWTLHRRPAVKAAARRKQALA
jgi:uncharacterized iron-regulated membrane protein